MSQQIPPKPSMQGQASRSSGKAIFSLVLGLMSMCMMFFTGIPAIILGIMAHSEIGRSQGQIKGSGMATIGIVLGVMGTLITPFLVLVALLLPAVQAAREAARRAQSQNQMRQIELGIHSFHDTFNKFPRAGVDGATEVDPNSPIHPNLSWRLSALPYSEGSGLYEQFALDQPWDSPQNLPLSSERVPVFTSPNLPKDDNRTLYLAFKKGPGTPPNLHTFFDEDRNARFSDATDGASNTIMFVEADADRAVIWARPVDLKLDWNSPMNGIGSLRPGGFMAALGDGSVQFIPNSIDPQVLRNMITRDDGQVVGGY